MHFVPDRRFLLRASLEFWLLLALLAAGLTYTQGSAYRDTCRRVEGLVIDQVGESLYRVGISPFKPRPLFRYELDGELHEAVPPNSDLPTGAHATLLVDPGNKRDIRVYNWGYWAQYAFNTFPIFLFGGLLYAALLVQSARLRKQLEIIAGVERRNTD